MDDEKYENESVRERGDKFLLATEGRKALALHLADQSATWVAMT